MKGQCHSVVKDKGAQSKEKNMQKVRTFCEPWRQKRPSLLLLLLMIMMVAACVDNSSTEELNAMRANLSELGGRLARMEGNGRKIARLESEIKDLQASMSNLNRNGNSLEEQLKKLDTQLEELKKSISTSKKKTEVKKTSVRRETPPGAGFYVVQQGDTLYRIANKHTLSVDELLEMNQMSKGQYIFPGQKLVVPKE